jgi:hypothetical protein
MTSLCPVLFFFTPSSSALLHLLLPLLHLLLPLLLPLREILAESRMKKRAEEEAKRAMDIKREIEKNKGNVQNRRDLLGEKETKKKIREVSKVQLLRTKATMYCISIYQLLSRTQSLVSVR